VSALSQSRRLLNPIERTSEILFGLIMVLTFTTSISVANGGEEDTRTILTGAIGCNLAWGFVDAVMYLMSNFMSRARGLATVRAVRATRDPDAAHRLILEALPSILAQTVTPAEVESLRERVGAMPDPADTVAFTGADFARALGVFLLVFVSTLPVVLPFVVIDDTRTALRASNAIAILLLFGAGWSLGSYSGRPGWRAGLGMVLIGLVLVAITVAMGG